MEYIDQEFREGTEITREEIKALISNDYATKEYADIARGNISSWSKALNTMNFTYATLSKGSQLAVLDFYCRYDDLLCFRAIGGSLSVSGSSSTYVQFPIYFDTEFDSDFATAAPLIMKMPRVSTSKFPYSPLYIQNYVFANNVGLSTGFHKAYIRISWAKGASSTLGVDIGSTPTNPFTLSIINYGQRFSVEQFA